MFSFLEWHNEELDGMKFSPDLVWLLSPVTLTPSLQSGSLCVLSFDSGKSESVSLPQDRLEGKSCLTWPDLTWPDLTWPDLIWPDLMSAGDWRVGAVGWASETVLGVRLQHRNNSCQQVLLCPATTLQCSPVTRRETRLSDAQSLLLGLHWQHQPQCPTLLSPPNLQVGTRARPPNGWDGSNQEWKVGILSGRTGVSSHHSHWLMF